jgi:hypothetical protein
MPAWQAGWLAGWKQFRLQEQQQADDDGFQKYQVWIEPEACRNTGLRWIWPADCMVSQLHGLSQLAPASNPL